MDPEGQDRHLGQRGLTPQDREDAEAVLLTERQVEQNDPGPFGPGRDQGPGQITNLNHTVAVLFQAHAHQASHLRLVVDEQHQAHEARSSLKT